MAPMLRSLLLLPLLLAGPAGTSPPLQPPQPVTPETAPAFPASADSVRRVTLAEAQEAIKSGKAVVVDVRSPGEYRTAHVQGAVSIPFAEIGERAKELPRDGFIITYCT